jgi:hypothetical protein
MAERFLKDSPIHSLEELKNRNPNLQIQPFTTEMKDHNGGAPRPMDCTLVRDSHGNAYLDAGKTGQFMESVQKNNMVFVREGNVANAQAQEVIRLNSVTASSLQGTEELKVAGQNTSNVSDIVGTASVQDGHRVTMLTGGIKDETAQAPRTLQPLEPTLDRVPQAPPNFNPLARMPEYAPQTNYVPPTNYMPYRPAPVRSYVPNHCGTGYGYLKIPDRQNLTPDTTRDRNSAPTGGRRQVHQLRVDPSTGQLY